MGISFAIPIDVAMDIQKQLRTSGKVSRGRLGVGIQELTKELAESFGLEPAKGVLVSSVEKDGAAEKAGILPGDIIVKFDDKTVGSPEELQRAVGATQPGSSVSVQILRKKSLKELSAVIGEMPDDTPATKSKQGQKPAEQPANRLGLVVIELSPAQLKDLKIDNGLLIEDIKGNASRTDLRRGDIILALIHRGEMVALKNAETFNKLLSQFDKKAGVSLLVKRGEAQIFVTIKPSSEDKD